MKGLMLCICFSCTLTYTNASKTIHVFVALCDNINQGIVKVPEKIGNGQDPKNNLYWGCAFGVKTFFKNSSDWVLVKTFAKPSTQILERLLFKHKTLDCYLLADAYDGAEIKQCTIDFLKASAGELPVMVKTDSTQLKFGGASNLISYIGHDGLMDFTLDEFPKKKNSEKRDVVILACYSKNYFTEAISKSGANPLLWSKHLMSPEAYTLKAAVDGWLLNETGEQVRTRAAKAYHQYQKCGEKAARTLLVSGW